MLLPLVFCGVILSFSCASDRKGQAFIMGQLSVGHGLPAEGLSLRLLYNKVCSLNKQWDQGLVQMGCPFGLCLVCLLTATKLDLGKGTVFMGM